MVLVAPIRPLHSTRAEVVGDVTAGREKRKCCEAESSANGQYGSAPLHPSPDHCSGYEDGEGDPGAPTTAFTWIPGRNERDRQNEHQTRREDTQRGHLI